MLSITPYHDANALIAYFATDLAGGPALPPDQGNGQWLGKGASLLGLHGTVTAHQLRRLAHNAHPGTGHRLTQRCAANRRVAHDLTISAPKTVSAMAEVVGDTRVTAAHDEAVADTMLVAEKLARTRVRQAGANTDRVTGNLIAAAFRHETSRANDPQLHTHVIVFNATNDVVEELWKALQPGEFYHQSGLLTEIYRTVLQSKLHQIGYRTKQTRTGFEIVGVPEDVTRLFSKRHAEIDGIEERLGSSGNAPLRKAIARCSREAKAGVQDAVQLRADWLAQLTADQVAQLDLLKRSANAPAKVQKVSPANAIRAAASHLFERHSVVPVHQLFREALVIGNGTITLAQLEFALPRDQSICRHGDNLTTCNAFMAEMQLVHLVDIGLNKFEPLHPTFIPSNKLSVEQHAVVVSMLSCRDAVMEFTGPAGAAKTTTLKQIAAGIRAGGKQIAVCAPTTSAVDVLRNEGFASSLTLQRLLTDERRQAKLAGAVIVLDEASMVSVAQMNRLFALANEYHWRIILCGDSRQHHSVDAGDALRVLELYSGLQRFEVTQIHRQLDPEFRECVEMLKDGYTGAAFKALSVRGSVHAIPEDAARYEHLGADFAAAVSAGESCLAVCVTRREAADASGAIRGALKAQNLLATEDEQLSVLDSFHLTEAQRKQASNYEVGHVIVFRRSTTYFKRGEHLIVTDVDGKSLVVKQADGRLSHLHPARVAQHFSVFSSRQIALSSGDHLLILENGHRLGGGRLTNGEIVKVEAIDHRGCVFLQDGRVIPPRFRFFTHGYAVTSQRAQGKTVDHALFAVDSRAAICAGNRDAFYVAASRGRYSCTIYTDDKEILRDALCRCGERMAAIELYGLMQREKEGCGSFSRMSQRAGWLEPAIS